MRASCFMRPQSYLKILALVSISILIHDTGWHSSAQADVFSDIGFTALKNELGAGTPTGAGVKVSHVEAGPPYGPDQLDPSFIGKNFNVLSSSSPGLSFHATSVGKNLYGIPDPNDPNSRSIAPDINEIDLWLAMNSLDLNDPNHWLINDFLRAGTSLEPGPQDPNNPIRVQNHSWIDQNGNFANPVDASRRVDYVINRDNLIVVAGQDNDNVNQGIAIPDLLGHLYNGITVGVTDGTHSHGFTTLEQAGRVKPEIVAPKGFTSFATPIVGAAAALLIEMTDDPNAGLSPASNSEAIKAIILAGATKEEFADWDRTTTRPLDMEVGAGELNVLRNHHILVAQQQVASSSTSVDPQGWDFRTTASNSLYFFEIPSGVAVSELSALLTWNRTITDGDPNDPNNFSPQFSGLENLDLKLYNSSSLVLGSTIDTSESVVDNIEHVYINEAMGLGDFLFEGQYALEVVSPVSGVDYGLAWLTTLQPIHNWASSAAVDNWATPGNWTPLASPASDWVARLENSSVADGQTATVSANSSVYKVMVSGSGGRMTFDINSGSTLTITSDLTVETGGAISGGGTIDGDLTNAGMQALGAAEELTVTGDADITGAMLVVTDNYTQTRGTNTGLFTLLSATAITGSFITPDGGGTASHLGRGHFLSKLTSTNTNIDVDILAALDGDTDGDRDVDITDFETFLNNFDPVGTDPGKLWIHGNFDFDDDVDITDFSFGLLPSLSATSGGTYGSQQAATGGGNFGSQPVTTGGGLVGFNQAVPEPAGLLLILGGAAFGLWCLGRRQN